MIGLRILQRGRSVDLALARQFLDVPVANVSDCMSRMTAGGASFLLGETTAKGVKMGQIAQDMADPKKWIPVELQ